MCSPTCRGGSPRRPPRRQTDAVWILKTRCPAVLLPLLVLACGNDSTPATAEQVEEAAPEDGELRVLTYNVHGLLEFITRDDTPARMRGISPLLAAFDVAAIQENFFYSPELMTDVEHPHVTHFDVVDEGTSTHSGLTLLSRVPIDASEGEAWVACNGGVNDGASDCLATKGLQWSRLHVGEAEYATIDIFNLHAEAGGGDKDNAARDSDIAQLLSAIEVRSADQAVVVVGDFNLHPGDPADDPLLAKLLAEGGLTNVCAAVECPEPDHIDRFYVRDGDRVTLTPKDWRWEEQFIDADGVDLSDHPALSSLIGWAAE